MSWQGVKQQINIEDIKAWCDKMGIRNYTINDKGEIDVNGGVMLVNKNFKELPYKFGRVTGFFTLENCKNLISLKNCPEIILSNHMFDIDGCTKLDSLEGCPTKVDGKFHCKGCKRKFTKKEVRSLCKVNGDIVNQ